MEHPITGMCFVTDLSAVPDGYAPISRSHDTNEDADLWKDKIFRRKVTRYLCVCRAFSDRNPNNVLVDLAVINDNDKMPAEFHRMDTTFDTGDKALKKKVLCCKFIPKDITNDAINEILLLAKLRRPPTGYTLIGDLNHMSLCMKMSAIPKPASTNTSQDTQQSMPPSYMSRPPTYSMDAQTQQNHSLVSPALPYSLNPAMAMHHNTELYQRQSSTLARAIMTSPLSGIPFELHSRFKDVQKIRNFQMPEIKYRTVAEITCEFDYSFRLEKQASQRQITPESEVPPS